MARLPTSLLATAAALAATPALAQERAVDVNVPAARLDQAIQILSSQSGVSIGFRDPQRNRPPPVIARDARGARQTGAPRDPSATGRQLHPIEFRARIHLAGDAHQPALALMRAAGETVAPLVIGQIL